MKQADAGVLETLPEETVISADTEQTLVVRRASNARIVLERGAKLTFVLLATEGWGENGEEVASRIGKPAPVLRFEFRGEGSELTFLGFVIGRSDARFPFETKSVHTVPHTKATYLLRAAMFDESFIDFKGNLIIEKPAQNTDAYLAHHTLLLGEKARARTVPALEIEADDVKAGHAATIGKVDRELLFYAASRGISEEEAISLLVKGFFAAQAEMIPDDNARQEVQQILMASL